MVKEQASDSSAAKFIGLNTLAEVIEKSSDLLYPQKQALLRVINRFVEQAEDIQGLTEKDILIERLKGQNIILNNQRSALIGANQALRIENTGLKARLVLSLGKKYKKMKELSKNGQRDIKNKIKIGKKLL